LTKYLQESNEKGSTLIEIIVAVTLLSLITIPFCGLFSQSVKSNRRTEEMMLATALAQDTIEELKSFSFEELLKKLTYQQKDIVKLDNYSFARSIKYLVKNENLLMITVTIKGDNQEVEVATYRGKY